ncbi:alkaline phosphatase D family protein [Orrella sp. JC864]|uniref:alkaline phosphatase D family protein n=1 Tax=Orrella sp. JC864 TaxID=3120298 RepID=UPI00300904E8
MSHRISRRRFLRNAAGSVTLASTLPLAACSSSDDDDENGQGGGVDRPQVSFAHGVASGDPLADRVVLWTRATPSRDETLAIDWEISSDQAFADIVGSGQVQTDDMRDYTVKVDADGLQPGTVYWYRFRHGDTVSPVGRTRTLPTGPVAQAKLAVFSCSNYPAGYFHVYAEAAQRGDLDVAVHLGDYIYEYGREGYASEQAAAMGREVEPAREIVSLADYRQRHAQYRRDPDLQALHAAMPMIAVWDDHEVTNDAWTDGAQNHQPELEGDYELRKAAAIRAYHEWLPTREQQPLNQIYRRFEFGDLLTLHMMDTRIIARERQLSYADYLPALLGNPDPQAGLADFLASFAADAAAPARQLIGPAQTQWLQEGLAASGATWQVLGQQVLMAPVHLPLPVLLGLLASAGELGGVTPPAGLVVDPATYVALLQRQMQGDPTLTPRELALLSLPCLPYNLDSWDGYWAARETVLRMAAALDRNLVVLAGDTHNAWASDLRDIAGNAVGVELATSSVSSPGFEEYLAGAGTPQELSALVRMLSNLNTLPAAQRWAGTLKYADTSQRGYMVVTATHAELRADWHYVSTVKDEQYTATLGHSLRTLPGAGQRTLVPA